MIITCSLLALLGAFFGALITTLNEKQSLDKKTFYIILKYVSNICLGVSSGIFLCLAVEFIFH
jgi:hypothetical protein